MVPKLVIDEKNDELNIFINPLLDKSFKNSDLSLDGIEPILTLRSNFPAGGKKEPIIEVVENFEEFDCHSEEKSSGSGLVARGNAKLCKLIFIQHKYLVEKLSAQQIAQEILCSKMAVLNALARFGISIREPHQHHGNPSQQRYGQKFQKIKLVEHSIEQRVINVVRELHEKSLSLRQIARVLNEMEIVTKNRGKRWHQEMVRRILLNI